MQKSTSKKGKLEKSSAGLVPAKLIFVLFLFGSDDFRYTLIDTAIACLSLMSLLLPETLLSCSVKMHEDIAMMA